jgi:hypothetical protein
MPRWGYKSTGMRRPLGGRMLRSIADHGDKWAAALDLIQSIRAFIPGLVSGGAIGTPSLDVAMAFPHSSLSKSLTIPAQLAAAAGEAGMEVQLSVYQTE